MILVVACPRSGTRYASRFYQAQGLELGHEKMGEDGTISWPFAVDSDRYPSWMPSMFLSQPVSHYNWTVKLHQTRHPLKVIASLSTINAEAWEWAQRFTGPLDGDDLTRRCALYLAWTGLCERVTSVQYRVEDIRDAWPRIAGLTGAAVELNGRAIAVPKRLNTRPHDPVSWGEVIRTPYGNAVKAKAERYGYE